MATFCVLVVRRRRLVNCLTTASFDPLVRLDQDKCYKVCSKNKKGMVSKFQGKETLTEISRMTVLLLYYGILISYTENLSLEPTKGEKICLRSTTADGFFLTITLSLLCHMKPQRTWRTSQTRIETSFHFFNILNDFHLNWEPKLLDLEVITWYLYQRYCICPSHHDSAHGRSKHLW